jgi:hypothetical protein
LFGHDSTPGLIAFEIEGTAKVKIFRRQDGKIEVDTALFHPFRTSVAVSVAPEIC